MKLFQLYMDIVCGCVLHHDISYNVLVCTSHAYPSRLRHRLFLANLSCCTLTRVRTNQRVIIWQPRTLVSHNFELLCIHIAKFLHAINTIDIHLPVDVLAQAACNYATIWILIDLKIATVTTPLPHINFEFLPI